MRAVVQRVDSVSVRVAGEDVARMGEGLLAFVGVGHDDGLEDARELARKLAQMRVFEDEHGRMNCSLEDTAGGLCVVSQFTLHADLRKGRRPSFGEAAPGEIAEPLVEAVVTGARALGVPVVTGRFGAKMEVALVNAGPVTLLLDTKRRF